MAKWARIMMSIMKNNSHFFIQNCIHYYICSLDFQLEIFFKKLVIDECRLFLGIFHLKFQNVKIWIN